MRWEIRRIVKSSGATAVYVTHDQAEALAIADRIALMNEGRIVQVGTGRELYEAPASRFVAEFLGEANFIPAEVVGPAEAGGVMLETPLGRLRSCSPGPLAQPGTKPHCCIRPESLRIVAGGEQAGGENTFPARLTEWTHLGDSARFRVTLADGTELSGAAMPARPVAVPGRQVTIHVPPEDVIVLSP
jgi:ABC-type Fe3+/spermidine/putrescine transport system ATPase subunit